VIAMGIAGPARRLWQSERHIDWIAWMPDGHRLVMDDEHADRWRLLSANRLGRAYALKRYGARPLPCCISPTSFTGL
jgi:hypothetical protein